MAKIPYSPVSKWSRGSLQRYAYIAIEAVLSGQPGDEAEASRILRVGLGKVPRRDLVDWAVIGRDMVEAALREKDTYWD
jgi:hypothetical protein